MKNMVSEVVAFINESFPDATVIVDVDSQSADVYIDCLAGEDFEVTLDVRPFGVQIAKVHKSEPEFTPFDLRFSNIDEVKNFLLTWKSTGRFDHGDPRASQ